MLIACGDLDARQQRVVVFVLACPMDDRITHENVMSSPLVACRTFERRYSHATLT
jgi:hypothetical protein